MASAETIFTLNAPAVLKEIAELQAIGRLFYSRGWSVGTSSNYSVVLQRQPLQILITASGKDKGALGANDFVIVDENAQPLSPAMPKPSAETHLHVLAARDYGANAVLHTHSVWATVLSDLFANDRALKIDGYEMLKGLRDITTHDLDYKVDIFENSQDIPALATAVKQRLATRATPAHGYLLRKHGLYTWGRDLFEARRHVEIFEFLFEAIGRRRSL